MKHLFTLSEWLRGKLVKLVNLVMQFLKLTKLTKLTEQIFAESLKSLKSLMSIFAGNESYESTEIYRVKSRITTTYLRLASVFTLVFVLGVGNVWGAPQTYNFSSLPTTGWTTSGNSQTINSKSWTYSSSTYIGNSSSNIQIGSKNNPQTSNWTIQTAISNFGTNKKITAVAITAYTTATTATYDISVGGSSVKSGSLTTSSATYTASSLNATSGNIVITLKGSSSSKAMYLSNIAVTYDDNSGPTLYTVTFDANGGSVTPASATQASAGAAITTPTPTRTGYTCSGWYTAASGGTKRCNAGGSYTPTATETIHAQWTANNYTVAWSVNGSSWTNGVSASNNNADYNTTVSAPAGAGNVPTTSNCDGSKVFVGWTATPIANATNTAPSDLFTTTSPAITENTTFYAVFATQSGGGSGSEELTSSELTTNITNTTCAYGTEKTWKDNNKIDYAFSVNTDAASRPWVQMKKGDITSYIGITAPGNISKVELTITAAANSSGGVTDISKHTKLPDGTTLNLNTSISTNSDNAVASASGDGSSTAMTINVSNPSNSTLYLQPIGGACRIWGIKVYYSNITYSNYATTCCTPLAQIKGSVNLSNPKTTEISWNNIDNVSSWTVNYKVHSAQGWTNHFTEKTGDDDEITIYSDGGTNNKMKTTIATACNTLYDFQIIANPASNYCDKDETLNNSGSGYNSGKWDLDYTFEGAQLKSGDLDEGTGVLCGDLDVTFEPLSGAYELPSDVTVTIGASTKTKGTDYTWNSSTGALHIDANKINGNVAISCTATLVGCTADPTIGTASLSGTFSSSAIGVAVTGCSTGANTCAWTDYGFVWGTSANPTGNKTVVGTEGSATSWNGSLAGTFAADQTYYFRAYGQNSKDGAAIVYGADATFTPRSVTFKDGSSTLSTVLVNNGATFAQPANPSKIGYDFVEWQLSGSAYDFASAVNSSIELQATWDEQDYSITKTFTGCTASLMPENYEYTGSGSDFTYTIAADDNYVLPTTITVTMGGEALTANTDYTWDSGNGQLAISKIITGDLVITVTADHLNTVTLKDRNNTLTQTTVGGNVELPTRTSCTGYTFAGWSTTYNEDWNTTAPTIIPAGDYVPTEDVDLYPVYTKTEQSGSANTYNLVTSANDLGDGDNILIVSPAGTVRDNQTDYNYNAQALTTTVAGTTRLDGTEVSISENSITTTTATVFTLSGNSDDGYKISSGSKYLYATAKNGMSTTETVGEALVFPISIADASPYKATIGNVTLGSDDCHLDFNPTVSSGSVNTYFAMYTNNQKGVYIYKSSVSSTTSYISVSECCDELATLNGGVTLTNEGCAAGELKATWKSNSEGLAGITSQVLHIYKASNDDEVLAKKVTGLTASIEDQTQTISGLETCTAYYVTVENISAGGFWCASGLAGEKSSNVTTKGYTYSFTLTGDHVTKKSGGANANTCAGNYEAIYEAITGWALPSTISVINAGTLNNGYTWNQTTGALVIDASKVTGDVTVTITATEVPCTALTSPSVTVSNKGYPYDAVTLSWSLIDNADGYTVEIYEGETLLESDALDGGAESYTITATLEHSTTYSYKLRATSETPAVHCPSEWATAEFETLDYPYVHVTYSENGETTNANTSAEPVDGRQLEHAFALPNSVSNECTKVFVGWTTATYSGDNEPAVFYAPGANFTIHENNDVTLYAVYATETPGASTTHTLTISDETQNTTYGSNSFTDDKSATWSGFCNIPDATHFGLRNESSQDKANENCHIASPVFANNITGITATIKNNSQSARSAYLCSSNTTNHPTSGDLGSASATGKASNAEYLEDEYTFTIANNASFNQFYLYTSGALQFHEIVVTCAGDPTYSAYATTCTGKVVKPVISDVTDGTTYESAQTITIETATPSAIIHYTTDGSAPTTSSPTYSVPFELSANGDYTIRAIAVKDGMDNSDEATSVSFSIDKPFTSIKELIDANLATNTSGKKLVFTAESKAIITAVNGSNHYVQDASGKGIVIRSNAWDEAAVAGKKIVGTITGTWDIYEGQMQLKDATFSDGMTFTPTEQLPDAITVSGDAATAFGAHPTVIVKLEDMYFQAEALNSNYSVVIKDALENAYTIYDRFNSLAEKDLPLITTACDVTGILTRHIKNETTTYQIIPLETSAVSTKGALAVLPTISDAGGNEESPATVATGKKITITENANFDAVYAINDGAETAINGSAQVTISETASATKLFVKASRDFYTDATVTYYYIADENLTEHSITCATGLAGGSIQANKPSAAKDAIIILTATPIDNYHFVEWSVTYNDGAEKTIDVENNQFSMPAYNVAVSATFAEDPFATVSFVKGEDAATGTAPASQKVYVNQNATMPVNPFTLDGHSFTGWKYDETTLQADDTYKVTAAGTITFTAQWAANPVCTVTLHATGADDDVHEVIQGTVFNLPDAAEFSGYTFIGWATAPQTSETTEEITVVPTAFTPEVLAMASTQDFYAVYTRTEGVARYERVTAYQSNWSGDYLIAYSDDKFADGRTAGESGIGANGASVNPGENLSDNVVAASWGNTYKVTLEEISSGSNTYLLKTQDGKYNYKTDNSNGINNNANRSTADDYPLTVTFNSSSDIAIANSAGAVFHYNTGSSGYFRFYNNATMNPVYLYKYIGATTYYTTNPSVKYTVSYDLGAGAWRSGEGCDETVVDAGESYPICEDQPVLENKIFVKWQVNDADVVFPLTINANTTFEAVYRDAEPYAVNYSANGGVGNAPEATNVKEAADYTVLANSWFFRSGYVFEGWNTAADGSGATYAADATMIMPSKAVTLYAQWEQLSANEKEVVIVSKIGNDYYAMGQTVTNSKQFNAIPVAGVSNGKVIIPNNFSNENKTAVTWRMVTNDNGATATFYSPANEKYLSHNGSDLSLSNTAFAWTWNNEKQCYVDENTRTFMYRNSYDYRSYLASSLGNSGYSDATYITTAFAKEIATNATESALSLGDNVVVKNGATLTVENQRFVNDVVVENGGTMATNAPMTVHDLIIHTTLGKGTGTTSSGNAPGACGQINNANNIAVTGDVFIQIELTQEPAASYGWYAFSVPFQVDALNGVYFGETKLINEKDYAIMSYHENVRAAGNYGWKKYRDIMKPGVLYLITVADTDYKTLRFKKVANTPMKANTDVAVTKTSGISTLDEGWNGIGNPNLQISNLSTSVPVMQFYDHKTNTFMGRNHSVNLVVGSAFFIQYGSTSTVSIPVGENAGNGYLAPTRSGNTVENEIFEVSLINNLTEETEDNIFFSAREEATKNYEIGRDVAKMSMGTAKCAQMSIPAYGTNLCAADFPLVNDKAEYPLTLTTPNAGSYRIEMANTYEDATLYLTKDGRVIWNLSMSPYEVTLDKGTTEGYGLKLVAKAPMVPTDIENGELLNGANGVQKVIIDEHVYILRGGEMYDVTGKAVK